MSKPALTDHYTISTQWETFIQVLSKLSAILGDRMGGEDKLPGQVHARSFCRLLESVKLSRACC